MPAIFDNGTVNRKETDEIILHYATNSKPFDKYKVYNSPDVKEALVKLFNNKCSYCESIITNHPGDVEHFRPKNQVQEQDKSLEKPGYFWLAADWSNLYLSCIDCNRRRYHTVPGERRKLMLGKLDQFPLKDKTKRWKNYANVLEKKVDEDARILIDPCIEDPEEFFEYNERGLILASPKAGTEKQVKATESIRVYALQRKGLVDERKRYFLLAIKKELLDISRIKTWLADESNIVKIKDMNTAIEEKISSLKKTIAKDQPYSAMARNLINSLLPDLMGTKTMEKVKKIKNTHPG